MKLKETSDKIFLTGFMGSGKTSVGQMLAQEMNLPFFDLDEIIIAQTHYTINEIFNRFGEKYFRELETENLLEITKNNSAFVLSTGGGVVLREENRVFMKQNGVVVFLYVDLDVIYERIKNNTDRPLLQTENPFQTLQFIWEQRKKKYFDCHITIDGSKLTIEKVVKKIKNNLGFSQK